MRADQGLLEIEFFGQRNEYQDRVRKTDGIRKSKKSLKLSPQKSREEKIENAANRLILTQETQHEFLDKNQKNQDLLSQKEPIIGQTIPKLSEVYEASKSISKKKNKVRGLTDFF